MKKENFITLILGVIGGMLFALGMCMCLIPEWDAFQQGIMVGLIGLVVLFIMLAVRRKMQGKTVVKFNAKIVRTVVLGIVSALILGIGMSMTMVWDNLLVPGIIVGMVGIIMLLCLIPIYKGIK